MHDIIFTSAETFGKSILKRTDGNSVTAAEPQRKLYESIVFILILFMKFNNTILT